MKLNLFTLSFGLSLWINPVQASETTFSETAWREIQPIYQSILNHPFNRELQNGTLPAVKFNYYEAQDSLYLLDFAKALTSLALKLEDPIEIEQLIGFANDCLKTERKTFNPVPKIEPATFHYVNFLLSTAAHQSKEELAAALLPCFWIYLRLAQDLAPTAKSKNPYQSWLNTYSSKSYEKDVKKMIHIVNRLAKETTPHLQSRMLQRFTQATYLELWFWDGAYQMKKWASY